MYSYNVSEWLLIFFIYCFFGWCFESTVVSVEQHRPVNRGFLRGPMLPIYGCGATIMLHVALPLMGHPVQIFFTGMLVATAFEYVVGLMMEMLFKVKYWDYSTHKFNFQGRICLQSSLAWGGLSLALPYVMHKPVERLVLRLSPTVTMILSLSIAACFLADALASIKTALDLAKLLEELEHIRQEANAARAALSTLAAEKLEEATEKRNELLSAAAEKRNAAAQVVDERRLQLHLALKTAEGQLETAAKNLRFDRRLLLRGNPDAVSEKFGEALRDLKKRLEH